METDLTKLLKKDVNKGYGLTGGGTSSETLSPDIANIGKAPTIAGGFIGGTILPDGTFQQALPGVSQEQLESGAGTGAKTPLNASKWSDLPPVTNTINTETLGTTAPMTIPEPEITPAPVLTPPPPPVEPTAPTEPTTPAVDPYANLKDYLGNLQAPASQADAFQQAQQDAEIQAKQQRLNQASAQLNSIYAEGERQKLQIDEDSFGKGGISAISNRRKSDIDRQTAIKSIPLQMELDLAQGDLMSAQSNLDTLFQLKSDDAQNMMEYKNKLAETVFNVATAEQQNVIEAQIREENRAFQIQQANQLNARNVANSIMSNQPKLASKMAQIDWSSPNAQNEFANLQSQVSEDPMDVLDMKIKQAQLTKLQKETSMIGQPTATERKLLRDQEEKEREAQRTVEGQNETLRTKLKLIENIQSKTTQLATRVGTNPFSRLSPNAIVKFFQIDPVGWAKGKEFAGLVHQLTSKEFVDTLIESKKQGAAYGQLSNQEGDDLRAAATAINDWEMKDKNGNKLGIWNVSEKAFNAELDKIKDLANTSILRATGSLVDNEEFMLIDNIYKDVDGLDYFNQ